MGFTIILDKTAHNVEIATLRPLVVRIDGLVYNVTACDDDQDGRHTIEINGKPLRFTRAQVRGRQILRVAGRTFESSLVDPRAAVEAEDSDHDHVRAPMPGIVIETHKQPGEEVFRGDALVTIESMKMQITLGSPRDGTLAALIRSVGETFDRDEIIAELVALQTAGE